MNGKKEQKKRESSLLRKTANSHGITDLSRRVGGVNIFANRMVQTPDSRTHGPLSPRQLQVFIVSLFQIRRSRDIAQVISEWEKDEHGMRDAVNSRQVRELKKQIRNFYPELSAFVPRLKSSKNKK